MIKESTNIKQQNVITQSKRIWTPMMTTCFVQILGEFEERYKIWKSLSPKTLFGDDDYGVLCHYDFSASEIDEAHIKDIKKAMLDLAKEGLYKLEDNGSWEYVNIIGKTKYSAVSKTFSVDLNHSFVPYLVQAKENGCYTTYNAYIARQFKGKYTERFYEFVCQYRRKKEKEFFLEIDNIREWFGLNEKKPRRVNGKLVEEVKYPRKNDFKKYVITPAEEEMKQLYEAGSCDVYFECFTKEDEKKSSGGRPSCDRLWFRIHEKTVITATPKPKPLDPRNRTEMLNASQLYVAFTNILNQIFSDEWGQNYLNLIKMPLAQLINRDRKQFDRLVSLVRGAQTDPTVRSVPKYARAIMEKEFGILPQKR